MRQIRQYIICGVESSLVHQQFRTRYCGHIKSHLGKFSTNRAKQLGFPTMSGETQTSEQVLTSIEAIYYFYSD